MPETKTPETKTLAGMLQVRFGDFDAAPGPEIEGNATLNDAQAADLVAGKYYVNIHTAANPGGEIRGQVTK